MTRLCNLSGPEQTHLREWAITRIFCDPSKDTTEDMWFECQNGRYPINAFVKFVQADQCALFCTDQGYPIYMVAIDRDGCAVTASTPMIEANRRSMTKAFKRFMRTEAGQKMFEGRWSGLEWSDVNVTRLNWSKFLGFMPASVMMEPKPVMRMFGFRRKEIPFPFSIIERLFYRPSMIRLKYKR